MNQTFNFSNKTTSEFQKSDYEPQHSIDNIQNEIKSISDEKNTTIKEGKKLKMTLLDPTDKICCQKILDANALI